MAKAIVIGGGVVGLACAWELARRDVEVTVVDAGAVGSGASAGNAGWICPTLVAPLPAPGMVREGLYQLVHGEGAFVLHPSLSLLPWLARFARNCTRARYEAGVRVLQELDRETMALYDAYVDAGVDFELHRQGLVIAARTRDGLAPYRRLARLLPYDVREVGAELEPALAPSVHALYAEVDRHVRPESLTAGLARSLAAAGVVLHEHRRVAAVERRGREWIVGDLAAPSVVVAAGVGSAELLRPHGVRLHLRGARGYSVDTTGSGNAPRHPLYLAEAKLAVSPFAETVRIAGVLELGGSPGRPDLLASARPYLGGWQPVAASETWSGLRPVTPSGLPRIGPVAPGLYVATGHGMLGVTLAAATARKLARSWKG
jgi:D-amino-acid dehydrogenase